MAAAPNKVTGSVRDHARSQGWTTGEYAAWLKEALAAALLTAE